MLDIFDTPNILELLGSTDTGRTKIALQVINKLQQKNDITLFGYVDTDQQLNLKPLEQNKIDLRRFYYFTALNELIYEMDFLVIDSLPTASLNSNPKFILSSLRRSIRAGKVRNVIVINQKRFNPGTEEEKSFAEDHIRRYCDYSLDLDSGDLRQNILQRPKTMEFERVLPRILSDEWVFE